MKVIAHKSLLMQLCEALTPELCRVEKAQCRQVAPPELPALPKATKPRPRLPLTSVTPRA